MPPKATKMSVSSAAREVIALAREVRDYYAAELPKWHPDYPLVRADEKSAPSPPAEAKLRSLLRSLSGEAVCQLLLIMYLGRGDFGVDDLAEAYAEIKRTIGKPENAISQMLNKAPLADYLSDGLAALFQDEIDADNLPLKAASQRKR